jgi:hypothetical protein
VWSFPNCREIRPCKYGLLNVGICTNMYGNKVIFDVLKDVAVKNITMLWDATRCNMVEVKFY